MSCNMERTTIVVVLIEPICKQLPKTVVVIRWKKPAFEKETVMTQKLARHRLYFQYSELPFRQKTEKTDVHKIQPRTLFCKRYIIKKVGKRSWVRMTFEPISFVMILFLMLATFFLLSLKKNSVSQSNLHQRQQLLKKLLMPQQQRKAAAANNNILSVVWQRLLTKNCSSRFLCCHKFVSKQFLTTLVF